MPMPGEFLSIASLNPKPRNWTVLHWNFREKDFRMYGSMCSSAVSKGVGRRMDMCIVPPLEGFAVLDVIVCDVAWRAAKCSAPHQVQECGLATPGWTHDCKHFSRHNWACDSMQNLLLHCRLPFELQWLFCTPTDPWLYCHSVFHIHKLQQQQSNRHAQSLHPSKHTHWSSTTWFPRSCLISTGPYTKQHYDVHEYWWEWFWCWCEMIIWYVITTCPVQLMQLVCCAQGAKILGNLATDWCNWIWILL